MAATMKDIAKRTGLGLATISKFLNGGTVKPKNKKLIEDAVKELHFVPKEFARSLKTSQWQPVYHLHHHHYGGYATQARLRRNCLRLPHRPAP